MGISEYIAKKKQIKAVKRDEKIMLLKPIVNILVGGFTQEEYGRLSGLLNQRIGDNGRIRGLKIAGESGGNGGTSRNGGTSGSGGISGNDGNDGSGSGNGNGADSGAGETALDGVFSLVIPGFQADEEYTLSGRARYQERTERSGTLQTSIGDYVNDVFNEVSTVPYAHKGQIRLNFIVKAESMEAAALGRLVKALKEGFWVSFPNGVNADVYLLLDQRGYKNSEQGEERKAFSYLAINEVRELKNGGTIKMPFLLSNYLSTDCLDKNAVFDIMTTIGLMMLIKDGQSAEAEGAVDCYRDESFMEDCGMDGDFYTLGHFKLTAAEDCIDYIVYKTVLDRMQVKAPNIDIRTKLSRMELLEDQIGGLADEILPLRGVRQQMLYPMVKNSAMNVAEFTNTGRQKLLQDLYGGNLDLFFRVNCEEQYQESLVQETAACTKRIRNVLKDIYENENYTVSDMNALLGGIRLHLGKTAGDTEEELDAQGKGMELWLEQKCDITNLKDKNKHTREPAAFYQLGKQYLDKKLQILHYTIKKKLVEQFRAEIDRSAAKYGMLAGRMKEASKELDSVAGLLMEKEPELCVGNLKDYYTLLADQILDESERFKTFETGLNSDIYAGDLEEEAIYGRIIDYCDGLVLSDARFEKDFSSEMLKRLINYDRFSSEEKIYDFAFETIMKHEVYYANFSSVAQMNREVCFLVNPNNRLVEGTKNRRQYLGASMQLKVFYEEYFTDMDVLFLQGCFKAESFYNYGVYESVYSRLKQAERNTPICSGEQQGEE